MQTNRLEFRSDNCGRAAPEMIEALVRENSGCALGYGGDTTTIELNKKISDIFETPVRVFPIPTGTAANALALSSVCSGFDAVYCSPEAHINTSECNSAGFFGQGLKVTPVEGAYGKVLAHSLKTAAANAGKGLAHKSQPAAVNLVQATDLGAVYSVSEIEELGFIAKEHDLIMHMDGARFANALATLKCTPAEMTWKAGIDILSLGVTKNGGLLTDAIVVFNQDIAKNISFQLRRAGMIWSKMRFASAQIMAYVEDDLWIRLATQSNAAATRIARGLETLEGVKLIAPVQANELFVEMNPSALNRLEQEGVLFYRRGPRLARFVCRWDSTLAESEALLALIERYRNLPD